MADFPTAGDDVIFATSSTGQTIDALAGNDSIFGSQGNDILIGNSGDDTLLGGLGLDSLRGGRFGSDTASYILATSGVVANLTFGYGYMTNPGDAADRDTYSSIENIDGGSGFDHLTGDGLANRLRGNGGADQLFGVGGNDLLEGGNGGDRIDGGGGDDTISGGAGNDSVIGGTGADEMSGGDGTDQLEYFASASGVHINLALNTAEGGDAQGDIISQFENIAGSQHDDILRGSKDENGLAGNAGDDQIFGVGGNDNLFGGEGDDRLHGGAGSDYIEGGFEYDVMSGGSGRDFFGYRFLADSGNGASQRDIITDFNVAEDVIDLLAIDALGGGQPAESFTFVGNGGFSGAGQVRFIIQNGNTIIAVRTGDSGPADFQIQLNGVHNLTESNFLL